ncbi:hypothetical protein L7F22_039792 [Adiantum nelumboides]|nr:hypothetical protein [Adiantum nelumboides]
MLIPGQLPPERPADHSIDLIPGSAAPNKPLYRVSAAQQEEIMTQVNELLQKGHIQPSSSPFCSHVLLVQKKDGSWRMYIDYRALNKITVKNKFPIPCIDDVLDRLQGAFFFSRIVLKSGYHQIRVNPANVPKTAFRTTFGLYEFLVMPFGLTNAHATFSCMMDIIFRPLRHCVRTFFNDMIGFSKSEAEHMEHLRAVFEMLRNSVWRETTASIQASEREAYYRARPYSARLEKVFQVQCDACGSSIGAVLMQDGHVIAYESRVLRGTEKHMQIYEK